MKKIFKVSGYILLAFIVLLIGVYFTFNQKLPVGQSGEKADALATKMMQAVNKTAWDSTAIVGWTYHGPHAYIWDKKRNLAQVKWEKNVAFINVATASGKVFTNNVEITDASKSAKLLQNAHKYFINDAFWLNPVVKAFDEGTTRSIVTRADGKEDLLVAYTSGGLTPGDAYLWILDENGLPTSWKLWAGIVPIGGVETSWEAWTTLPTGAKIATAHKLKGTNMIIPITDLKSANTFKEFGLAEDPFVVLTH